MEGTLSTELLHQSLGGGKGGQKSGVISIGVYGYWMLSPPTLDLHPPGSLLPSDLGFPGPGHSVCWRIKVDVSDSVWEFCYGWERHPHSGGLGPSWFEGWS